jgi:DNA-binding NarL/FixJ family response regulator
VPVTVALAEDNLIVREGIARLLGGNGSGVEVVAECEDLDSVVRAVERVRPDVVLTDIRMPPAHDDEGIRLAAIARERYPEMGVVILSSYSDPMYVLALLESGLGRRAYLLKERVSDRAQLVFAIHSVATGGSMLDPAVVEPLLTARAQRSPVAELSAREREVLGQLALGKSNAAIGDALFLTKRAVERHVTSIFVKLDLADAEDVSKRVKAMLLFLAEREVHG